MGGSGMSYSHLLSSEEWRKRRLEIIKLAGNDCEWCSMIHNSLDESFVKHSLSNRKKDGQLYIHHLVYRGGRMPWEYGDQDLICLCKTCHEYYHDVLDCLRDMVVFVGCSKENNTPIDNVKDYIYNELNRIYINKKGNMHLKMSDTDISKMMDRRVDRINTDKIDKEN